MMRLAKKLARWARLEAMTHDRGNGRPVQKTAVPRTVLGHPRTGCGGSAVRLACLLTAMMAFLVSRGGAATLPSITFQPQNASAAIGAGVSFAVGATGDGPLSYEWWNSFGPLHPPQTAPVLTLASVQPGEAGGYFVRVRNAAGTVTSSAATLTVTGAPEENFLFARKGAGTGAEPGANIDLDSAGNVFVVGSFTGTAAFGAFNLTSAGGRDIFIAKHDRTGNVLWARRAGGSGDDHGAGVAVDRAGNLRVTGSFSGSAGFGGTSLNAGGSSDGFVASFDRDGNVLWAQPVGGSGTARGWRIACDAAGNATVVGSFSGNATVGATALTSAGGEDAFVAKFSAGGVPLWAKRFGGTGAEQGTGLALDPDANLFLTGSFQGTVNFGGTSLSAGGGTQTFLVKCDRAGVVQWAKKAAGLDSAAGTTVIAEDDGTCNLTGTFSATATFGTTTLANREAGERFITKYDSAGAVLWAARSDDAGAQVGLRSENTAVTGAFGSGSLDWSGGAGGGVDLFVAQYSGPGVATWARQAGASQAAFTLGLMADGNGQRYLTGFFEDDDGVLSGGGYSLAKISLAQAAGPLPPVITLMPQGQNASAGGSVTFAVTATGASALNYQWRHNGVDLPGATSATLALNNVQAASAGNYSVLVWNADGAAVSSEAALAVQGPPVSELTLTISGQGSVTPNLHGQLLEIGASYSLTAVAAPGHEFAGWSGGASGSGATLSFVMQAGLALQANFVASTNNPPPPPPVTNALVLRRATYNGLFHEAGELRPESAGFFSLATTPNGRYTAWLTPGGRRFALSGRFDLAGLATNRIFRAGTNMLTVTLELASTNGVDHARGTVLIGNTLSTLWAGRAASGSPTNPVPWAGRYTMAVPGADDGIAPAGDGFGTALVDARGRLTAGMTLGDGTRVTPAIALTDHGLWPFYARLPAGKGVAASWVTFSDQAGDDFAGDVSWVCPPLATRRFFPAGFAAQTAIVGSRYARPLPNTNRVVDVELGSLQFLGGNLLAPFANEVLVTTNNRVVNLGSNKLTLTLTLPTGLFNGRVVDPLTGRAIPFKGALLQKRDLGAGQFNGTNQTGRVRLGSGSVGQ